MADKYLVPQRLDDPELIGFWTVDEFAGLLIPFAWGILAQHIFIGIALAFAAWFVLRKAKSGNAGSALVHAAYWYLPGGFLGLKARSEEHTSELQSLMRISYAVFCLKKKKRIIS